MNLKALYLSLIMFLGIGTFSPSYSNPHLKQKTQNSEIIFNKKNNSITITWTEIGESGNYVISRGGSRLATEFIQVGSTSKLTFIDRKPNKNKYENYYKITRGKQSILISLENQIFGEHVYFYDRKYEQAITAQQELKAHFPYIGLGGANGEWTTKRQAYYFKPNIDGQSYDPGGSGSASSDSANSIELGFYSHIGGLGLLPTDVKLGSLFTRPHLSGGANATCTFWRSVENVTIQRDFAWTVSQSTSARRLQIESTSKFISDIGDTNFWGSGGFIADSHFKTTRPHWAGQQQWYTRNTIFPEGTGTMGGSYNMVWQGCLNPPASDQINSIIKTTPVIREKPFIFIDKDGEYKVFVPDWQHDRKGTSWNQNDPGKGEIQDLLSQWYVIKEGDTEKEINEALKNGKNIFSPLDIMP